MLLGFFFDIMVRVMMGRVFVEATNVVMCWHSIHSLHMLIRLWLIDIISDFAATIVLSWTSGVMWALMMCVMVMMMVVMMLQVFYFLATLVFQLWHMLVRFLEFGALMINIII